MFCAASLMRSPWHVRKSEAKPSLAVVIASLIHYYHHHVGCISNVTGHRITWKYVSIFPKAALSRIVTVSLALPLMSSVPSKSDEKITIVQCSKHEYLRVTIIVADFRNAIISMCLQGKPARSTWEFSSTTPGRNPWTRTATTRLYQRNCRPLRVRPSNRVRIKFPSRRRREPRRNRNSIAGDLDRTRACTSSSVIVERSAAPTFSDRTWRIWCSSKTPRATGNISSPKRRFARNRSGGTRKAS